MLSARSSSRPDIGDSLVSSSTVDDNQQPGTSLGGVDRPREGLNSASSNRPRTGGASKGTVPKWFKGTGKNEERFQFIGYFSTRGNIVYIYLCKPFQNSTTSFKLNSSLKVCPARFLLFPF